MVTYICDDFRAKQLNAWPLSVDQFIENCESINRFCSYQTVDTFRPYNFPMHRPCIDPEKHATAQDPWFKIAAQTWTMFIMLAAQVDSHGISTVPTPLYLLKLRITWPTRKSQPWTRPNKADKTRQDFVCSAQQPVVHTLGSSILFRRCCRGLSYKLNTAWY